MRAQKSVGRIDISTNELVETIAIEAIPYDLILDGNALWISAFDDDEVIRIDLDTKKVTTIHAISKPLGIAVSGDSVWVVEHRNGELVRIDSQTNNVLARIDLSLPAPAPGAQPEEVIIAEGSVWVANNGGRTVSRVDAVTNEILATIPFEGPLKPVRLAAGGGFIWVSLVEEVGSTAGDWIAQINPATNEVVKETPFDYAGFLIYDNDTLWVGDSYGNIDKRAGDRVFRIELMP
jgi:DNA-binding beta-propeller fold protein YncE